MELFDQGASVQHRDRSVDDGEFGEVGAGVVDDPEDEQSAVVMGRQADAGMFVRGFDDALRDGVAGVGGNDGGEQFFKPLDAIFLELEVGGFLNTVRREHHNVTGEKRQADFVVFGFGNHAEGETGDVDFGDQAFANEDGQSPAGIGEGQFTERGVVNAEMHGDKAGVQARGNEAGIQNFQNLRRRGFGVVDEFAQDADGQRAIESGGSAFSGDIAIHDGETANTIGKQIVEVTAKFARGNVGGGNIQARDFAGAVGKKLALNFPRGFQIILHARLSFPRFLEEPGVFESDGDVGAENIEHTLVFGRKGLRFGAFKVQDPDEAILEKQRDDEFGADFDIIAVIDVAGIQAHVDNPNGAALGGGGAGDALVERHLDARGNGVFITHGENGFQELSAFIPEHDAEDVIVDDSLDAFGDAAQEFFTVEDGGEFMAHFVKERKGVGLRGGKEGGHNGICGSTLGKRSYFWALFHSVVGTNG